MVSSRRAQVTPEFAFREGKKLTDAANEETLQSVFLREDGPQGALLQTVEFEETRSAKPHRVLDYCRPSRQRKESLSSESKAVKRSIDALLYPCKVRRTLVDCTVSTTVRR